MDKSPDLGQIPYLAVLHLAGCLDTAGRANLDGLHAVAVCLVRQCVEVLTLVDIGLQEPEFAHPLLADWKSGKKTHGQLRAMLESTIWPAYGNGLWNEPWSEFFANLSKAVQPYAHYSYGLMGWQLATLATDEVRGGHEALVQFGAGTYDPLKASRLTLLDALIVWALGRLILMPNPPGRTHPLAAGVHALGRRIAQSKLLFREGQWDWQLLPDVWFRPGFDWLDP